MVVRYTLLNALFSGTQMTQKISGFTTSSRLDRFGFRSTLFNWEAAWMDSIEQEHIEALRNGLVAVLPTAIISVEIEPQVPPEQHDHEAESITRLLSLGSGVATRWAARQIWQEGQLIQEMFVRRIVTTTAEDKSRYNLISNCDESNLEHFLTSCLTKYREAETALCLNAVITYLEQARHEKNPELKLAVLILALETLSYHWCLRDGLSAQQLESIPLQNKLLRMRNRKFKFIEKAIVNHTLRTGLRNPLIHSGQIPMMATEEKLIWVNSLYALSLKILLCELGYRGRYRDLANGLALVSAPN